MPKRGDLVGHRLCQRMPCQKWPALVSYWAARRRRLQREVAFRPKARLRRAQHALASVRKYQGYPTAFAQPQGKHCATASGSALGTCPGRGGPRAARWGFGSSKHVPAAGAVPWGAGQAKRQHAEGRRQGGGDIRGPRTAARRPCRGDLPSIIFANRFGLPSAWCLGQSPRSLGLPGCGRVATAGHGIRPLATANRASCAACRGQESALCPSAGEPS